MHRTNDYTNLDIITFVIVSDKILDFESHYRYIELCCESP